ncbi:MAG TPA: alpha/beta family hydrolase [Terriglobales bacterium]|nr:alpha/beta family hydrolase [Terriglobales bacterium]
MAEESTQFTDLSGATPVRGYLHLPGEANGDAVVFTHGAGGNSNSSLLKALGDVFAASGYLFLRCDLPFRQARPAGPPRPGDAARDREGLKRAAELMRSRVHGRVFLGGQSYGGRQATMLVADEPTLADGLLLTSYPLHPPGKPEQVRTQHFPRLRTPALFVEGSRDAFASFAEMEAALKLIPARTTMLGIDRAGHDLVGRKAAMAEQLARKILDSFENFFQRK